SVLPKRWPWPPRLRPSTGPPHRAGYKPSSCHGLLVEAGDDRVEALLVDAAVEIVADHHRRRQRAVPEAVHGEQREAAVLARLAELDAELALRVRARLLGVHRLAGLSAAHLDDVAAAGRLAEVVVEAEHAVDLGARAVQRVRDLGERLLRDVAELFLQLVE